MLQASITVFPNMEQVWEDVDGVMTCDPAVCRNAMPQPYLTFEEAAQIMSFGTQDMLTSIVLKSNIIMLNIESKRVPAQSNFVATCKSTFENEHIVVYYFVSSEDRISAIVASSKQSTPELVQKELGTVVKKLGEFADVDLQDRSMISLVGKAHKSTRILRKASRALDKIDVDVDMLVQLPAKQDEQVTNVSFVVKDSEAKRSVRALYSAFFELNGCPVPVPVPVNSSAVASSSSEKRKVDDDHPEAPPSVRQLQMTGTDPSVGQERTDDSAPEASVSRSRGVLREVGEGSSRAPNVLDENEHMMFNDEHMMFSGGNGFGYLPAAGYPPRTAYQTLAPYPPPAAGYQMSARGDGSGYSVVLAARARDGDHCPLFNMEEWLADSP